MDNKTFFTIGQQFVMPDLQTESSPTMKHCPVDERGMTNDVKVKRKLMAIVANYGNVPC